jgi:hypothetical protein
VGGWHLGRQWSLQSALDGPDVACYLVYADFVERGPVSARGFGGAAAAAGVSQIVYVGWRCDGRVRVITAVVMTTRGQRGSPT